MPRRKEVSYSLTQEIESDDKSSSEEVEIPKNKRAQKKITEYERQRMKRIEENRARMEALGLKKMADSFVGSIPEPANKIIDNKGKRKVDDDDEEYMPSEGEKTLDSSSEDDEKNLEDIKEYSVSSAKRKTQEKNRKPKKASSSVKHYEESGFVDDNEALVQAIALSLQDSAGCVDINSLESQSSTTPASNIMSNEKKENSPNQETTGKRKRKKLMNSRVQMTDDDLILYFFQLDEAGKGSITIRDLRRMVASHDFTWSDKEMEEMIKYFDSDGDGKLNLDDFRKIATRCHMMQSS